MLSLDTAQYWLTRLCFQRALAFIYLLGFLIAANQVVPLLGRHGLVPIPLFLKQVRFWDAPSLFWWKCSDRALLVVAWAGVGLSLVALVGISERFGMVVSVTVWALLWLLYLSFVNVGQTFYGFGWETLLLEAGFLAIFLGPARAAPPTVVIWLLRWVLFRVMFGAGVIKLRGDSCWRDLTCMFYHYETQPLPNPLSWYFHRLPAFVHRGGVLFTHFVELVVPWAYFAPRPWCYVAGLITILFQLTLILSGNLSWLNYVTIALCIPCFDDAFLSRLVPLTLPTVVPAGEPRQVVLAILTLVILALSIRPALNLLSSRQRMNASFDPLHLVNTYGAFGSITRERMEVILEGTSEPVVTEETVWREYQFKAKPGDVSRRPAIVSPYHYRLDWQMWFAAMSEYYDHPWILNLVAKLLHGDPGTLSLIAGNPFPASPPQYIRARLYHYRFAPPGDRNWWQRTLIQEYLPPLSLRDPAFRRALDEMGWNEER